MIKYPGNQEAAKTKTGNFLSKPCQKLWKFVVVNVDNQCEYQQGQNDSKQGWIITPSAQNEGSFIGTPITKSSRKNCPENDQQNVHAFFNIKSVFAQVTTDIVIRDRVETFPPSRNDLGKSRGGCPGKGLEIINI